MMLPSQVASGNLTVYVLEIAMFMYVYMYIYVRMHNWIIGPIGLGFPHRIQWGMFLSKPFVCLRLTIIAAYIIIYWYHSIPIKYPYRLSRYQITYGR